LTSSQVEEITRGIPADFVHFHIVNLLINDIKCPRVYDTDSVILKAQYKENVKRDSQPDYTIAFQYTLSPTAM
jgi:hypothetical protein